MVSNTQLNRANGKGTGQDSHGCEPCKVHLLSQQQGSLSGMPQIHSYGTTAKNKTFGSVITIMVDQYVVTQISTESITLTMGGAKVTGLAPLSISLA